MSLFSIHRISITTADTKLTMAAPINIFRPPNLSYASPPMMLPITLPTPNVPIYIPMRLDTESFDVLLMWSKIVTLITWKFIGLET